MSAQSIQPLEAALWLSELEKLAVRRARADGGAPDQLFRKAFYLIQLAPVSLRRHIACQVEEETLEGFLDCGAYLSAVVAMIPPPNAVAVVRNTASDRTRATVSLSAANCTGEDDDAEPAKALLGAWLKAVLLFADTGAETFIGRRERLSEEHSASSQTTKH